MQSSLTRHKSLTTLLLLLLVCLQVQAGLACEMMEHNAPVEMDHSVAVEDCCCSEPSTEPSITEDSQCCQYEHTVSVKGADPEQDNAPPALVKPPELKPPPFLAALLIVLFDQPILADRFTVTTIDAPPSTAGTLLYLTTQRLRI